MNTPKRAPRVLRISERVYGALLAAYPLEFRQEYGRHMVQVFRDVCRDAYRTRGEIGLFLWWTAALIDLLHTAFAERRKVWVTMSFVNFVVSNGRLLIIGGILLLVSAIGQLFPYTSLAWAYPWTVYALVVGMGVVTAGLLRLFADLNPQLNLFGRVALLAAAIGGAVATVGWLLMLIAPSSFFGILMAGWMLHLMGVSVFGGYAVTTHLLPRWNFTLLIGSAFPLLISLIVFQGVTIHSTGIGTTESSMITTYIFPGFTVGFGRNWGAVAMLLLIGFGWVLSGLALERKSDAAQSLTVQHS